MELIVANPLRNVKRETVCPKRETRALNKEEMLLYIKAADRDINCGALVHLALDSTMRREDLAGLQWSAVDLDHRTIELTEVLIWTKETGTGFAEPKTAAGKRTITISNKTVAALRQHKQHQELQKLSAGDTWEDHNLVFPSKDGRPGTPHNIYQRFI